MKENSWDLKAVTIIVFRVFDNVILTETGCNYLAAFRGNEKFSLSTCLKFNFCET
jgi:hypothetical protein